MQMIAKCLQNLKFQYSNKFSQCNKLAINSALIKENKKQDYFLQSHKCYILKKIY